VPVGCHCSDRISFWNGFCATRPHAGIRYTNICQERRAERLSAWSHFRFKATPSQAVLDQLNIAFGAKAIGKIPEIGVTHFQVAPQAGLALLEHLRSRSDVDFAEFDSIVKAFLQPDDPYFSTSFGSSHYGSVSQWGPQAVSAPAAWD